MALLVYYILKQILQAIFQLEESLTIKLYN